MSSKRMLKINPDILDILVILSLPYCRIIRLIYENECLEFNSN